ncbi:hypothetical protein SPLC1_S032780 [Arthrospira platensis C1]|nr:hypothetical protein SPLC1_S032780 [Arthrospira platensis C1]
METPAVKSSIIFSILTAVSQEKALFYSGSSVPHILYPKLQSHQVSVIE